MMRALYYSTHILRIGCVVQRKVLKHFWYCIVYVYLMCAIHFRPFFYVLLFAFLFDILPSVILFQALFQPNNFLLLLRKFKNTSRLFFFSYFVSFSFLFCINNFNFFSFFIDRMIYRINFNIILNYYFERFVWHRNKIRKSSSSF